MSLSTLRRALCLLGIFILGLCLDPTPLVAQYRYPPNYPAGAGYGRYEADARVEVKPNTASVYVDGYLAGKVDEFDGVFQRLHLEAGEHEIVVYLPGYKRLQERLYFSPNQTRKITGTLEPLAGEPDPGPPVPQPRPERPEARPSATLSIMVSPPDAEVMVDGQQWRSSQNNERLIIQVSEGRHLVEVSKTGYRRFTTEVELRPGETSPINVSLTPDR